VECLAEKASCAKYAAGYPLLFSSIFIDYIIW
jgi:hypothetical protein